jgi:hypothetical protein
MYVLIVGLAMNHERIKQLLEECMAGRATAWKCGCCLGLNINKPKINCTYCKEDYREPIQEDLLVSAYLTHCRKDA